jgi:Flp pilus assembly protein TadG
MKRDKEPYSRRVWKDRRGAVAILVAVGLFALIGFGALVVDLGYLFFAQFALQAATNAAALAGAQDIGSGGAPCATATNYSAYAGDMNALSNGMTVASPTAKLLCLSGWGITCSANQSTSSCSGNSPSTANVLEVTDTASVPVFFAHLWGVSPWSISATAVASAKGGAPGPFNVAFILDTTHSMASLSGGATATACPGFSSAVDCAAAGVQTLLKELWPCAPGTCGTSTPTPFDETALFVFPPVTNSSQATADIGCTSPTIAPYYSGLLNTAGSATAAGSPTLHLGTSIASSTASNAFNTGSSALVTDGIVTSGPTASGSTTLKFASATFPYATTAIVNMSILDVSNVGVIPSGTKVSSATTAAGTVTVTMSNAATGIGVTSGDWISFGGIPAGTGGNTWPWWGNTSPTTISQATPPTSTVTMSGNAGGPGVPVGDNIAVAPLYQIVGFANNFGTSDPASTLNTSSNIVKVTNAGCLGAPGGLGTYYAEAILTAQSALVAEQAARKNAGQIPGTNVIILLSDGAASSTSAQMGALETANANSECHAAIAAAQNAAAAGQTVTALGTWVFTIFFDDGSYTCNDTAAVTNSATGATGSCAAMQLIANAPIATSPYYFNDSAKFFSTDGTSGTCPSTSKYSTVNDIFGQGIGGALTNARLLPTACAGSSPPSGC